MKIDIFNHFFPARFYEKVMEVAPEHKDLGKRVRNIPCLVDLDVRFKIMDEFGAYCQLLSLPGPPTEVFAGPDVSPELARIGNDGLAELVAKYPDRFPGFIASLPMNNPEAAVAEMHRAINDLEANAVQVYSNAAGMPLDGDEFEPIFESMATYDRPILIHPIRGSNHPDYLNEDYSQYEIWWTLGWPYETSAAMARLVFSGIFDRYPDLKIITHHMGGLVPYLEGRVGPGWDQLGKRTSDRDYSVVLKSLKKRPLDYFKMFYGDTALFGAASATRCGLDFFGVDHALFASDSPFDPEMGSMYIRETIKIIEELDITPEERDQIFRGNAKKMFKL
ncbi:MAG TPA: amidohydrolase [Candidatus Latescibacteria bacterium]|jgi:predicted TIM-barrel fold metal-dependent hydrolase|nr:amidohydrolase [Candidatus Latescibacterota bacterium]